jgi:hypothetical protein
VEVDVVVHLAGEHDLAAVVDGALDVGAAGVPIDGGCRGRGVVPPAAPRIRRAGPAVFDDEGGVSLGVGFLEMLLAGWPSVGIEDKGEECELTRRSRYSVNFAPQKGQLCDCSASSIVAGAIRLLRLTL